MHVHMCVFAYFGEEDSIFEWILGESVDNVKEVFLNEIAVCQEFKVFEVNIQEIMLSDLIGETKGETH